MIDNIEKPLAIASVRWVSAAAGGRRSGPPTAPVYAATAVFVLGGECEVVPGWPATADQLSVLLQKTDERSDGTHVDKVDFLVPDLAIPMLRTGAEFLVMEGPKVVARAVVEEDLVPRS